MFKEKKNFLPNNPLSKKFEQIARERGTIAEDKVEAVLKKINLRYKRHPHYSKRDRKGIDFEVWTDNCHVLINVKSSIKGVKKLLSHNREHKTIVFPLLVEPGENEHVIMLRLYRLIGEYKEFAKRIQGTRKQDMQDLENWEDWQQWRQWQENIKRTE